MEMEVDVSQAENMRTTALKAMPFIVGEKASNCIPVYHGHQFFGWISLPSIFWEKRGHIIIK